MIRSSAEIMAEVARLDAELGRPLKQPNRHGNLIRTNRYPVVRKARQPKNRLCELVPGCTMPHVAKGLCATHRYRLRKYGDPLGGLDRPGPVSLGPIEGLGGV